MTVELLLQSLAIIISVVGIVMPVLLTFRGETRKAIHELRGSVQTLVVDVAILKERDRVAEILDGRYKKE